MAGCSCGGRRVVLDLWPDLVVALMMSGLFVYTALVIFNQA